MFIQSDIDLISLLRDTSSVAKAVLAVLLIFSIWSWGIILSKVLLFRRVAHETGKFWNIFRKGHSLTEISTACESLGFTPLVPVFNSAVEAMQPRARLGSGGGGGTAIQRAVSVPTLQRVMQRSAAAQLTVLE